MGGALALALSGLTCALLTYGFLACVIFVMGLLLNREAQIPLGPMTRGSVHDPNKIVRMRSGMFFSTLKRLAPSGFQCFSVLVSWGYSVFKRHWLMVFWRNIRC